MITQRENMLNIMRGKKPEWIPFVPLIDNFNYIWPLPDNSIEKNDYVKMAKYFKREAINRCVNPPIQTHIKGAVLNTSTDADKITNIWQTELGILKSTSVQRCNPDICFCIEHFIKTEEDYKIFHSILENTTYEKSDEEIANILSKLQIMGDDGIIYVVGPESPIMRLVRSEVGIEQFAYDYADYPGIVMETMELLEHKAYEQYELIARYSPAHVVVMWEDVTTNNVSRYMVEKHVVPVIKRYAEICHKYGKILVMHNCGKIRAIMDLFPEMDIDAIDWCSPSPVGDITYSELRKCWGNNITILGTPDPSMIRYATSREIQEYIDDIFRQIAPGNRFIFMPPVPFGTEIERMNELVMIADKYREYPVRI